MDAVLPDQAYDLVGVSFGCLVAMEMRCQLEKFHSNSDKLGKIVLVDASPDIIPKLHGDSLQVLRGQSQHTQEVTIFTSFVESLTGETSLKEVKYIQPHMFTSSHCELI